MIVANLLGALDGPDLLIILLIVLLLFGGTKLPQLARSLGQAKREFHDATEAPPAPAPIEPSSPPDTVTITREEHDRLRAAADEHTATTNDPTQN
jgi:sec-independent protein translocase protein TatA